MKKLTTIDEIRAKVLQTGRPAQGAIAYDPAYDKRMPWLMAERPGRGVTVRFYPRSGGKVSGMVVVGIVS